MEKYITKNGIQYELRGDQYYPMLALGEQTDYGIGKYGRMRLDYFNQYRRGTYTTLLTEGRLNEHLHEIDVQAREMVEWIIDQTVYLAHNVVINRCILTVILFREAIAATANVTTSAPKKKCRR